jgi:hypothetical protein
MKKGLIFGKSKRVSERWNWKLVRRAMGMMLAMMVSGKGFSHSSAAGNH